MSITERAEQIVYIKPGFPMIDIVSINHMRSEVDGQQLPWSPVSKAYQPEAAPVKVNFQDFTRAGVQECTRSRNGQIHLDEIFVAAGQFNKKS